MTFSRRTFLKTAGASAGAAAMTFPVQPARAGTRPGAAGEPDLPRGLTLGTIVRRGEWSLAVRTAKGVLDVAGAAEDIDLTVPRNMDELFTQGGGSKLPGLVQTALDNPRLARHFAAESQVEFGPCVTNPQKIICVGLNYRKHAQEIGAQPPATPMLFNKYNNALMGHRGTLTLPVQVAQAFDYEVELVIVMGRRTRDVARERALAHVAGYCTGNDMSARDLQRKTSQFMLGKTCDRFAPIGPWLVSADQVPDPNALPLWCEVNGERRQDSSTADMIFGCAELVSYISRHMTLEPGDLIFTGTPEGVIAGHRPEKQVWLKPGDRIRCAVGALGVLEYTLA